MINYKDVTIIIPHFGNSPESEYAIGQCVLSLEETAPEIRRIIVKNGPECEHPGNIRLDDQGQCKAVNAAVASTNTPWILVTNDDMVYSPEWFERLIDNIGDNLCISPKLIEPRPGAPTFETYFCGGAGGDFDLEKWLLFATTIHQGEGIRTGFNLPFLIKRSLWDMVGGYDINYDPWGSNSDSDLEYKIKLAGIQPMQNTNSIVYHFSQTSGTFSPEHQDAWGRNFQYFTDKWGFPRTDQGIWEASFTIPDEERIFRPSWEAKLISNLSRFEKLEQKAPPGAFSTIDMEVIVPEIEKLEDGDIYLEIGVDKGKSLSIARMVSKPNVRIYGVDLEKDPNIEGTAVIRGDSSSVGKNYPGGEISLLFIDGDHTYEGCKKDINAWLPHLKKGGQIFFHDCDESSPGVVQAVSELVTNSKFKVDKFEFFKRTDRNTSMARVKFL